MQQERNRELQQYALLCALGIIAAVMIKIQSRRINISYLSYYLSISLYYLTLSKSDLWLFRD